MKTHELALSLLERPNGFLLISVDVSTGDGDSGSRVLAVAEGLQPNTNPNDTVLLCSGELNTKM